MIDIQHMRITGYASWTYNYSMRLPLWIYKLYEGSIKEAKDRIADVLNEYNYKDIEQLGIFKYFAKFPYDRGQLYSNYFNEAQEHEQLPAYYPYLTKYTYQQAMAWAAANGVHLQVTFIEPDSPNYRASEDGWVVSQYPRQGALVSEWPNGQITVMGSGDPNYVPEYTVEGCDDQNSCRLFAESKGINFTIGYVYDNSKNEGDFAGSNFKNGDTIKQDDTLIAYEYKHKEEVDVPLAQGNYINYAQSLENLGFIIQYSPVYDSSDPTADGSVIDVFNQSWQSVSNSKADKGATLILRYYKYVVCASPNSVLNSNTGECDCVAGYEKDAGGACVLSGGESGGQSGSGSSSGNPSGGGESGGGETGGGETGGGEQESGE